MSDQSRFSAAPFRFGSRSGVRSGAMAFAAACGLCVGAMFTVTGCDSEGGAEPAAKLASATIEVPVYGMDCEGCVASVHRMITNRVDGVVSCEVDLDGQVARVQVTDEVDRAMLVAAIEAAGFSTEPSEGDGGHEDEHGHDHDHDHGDGHDHDHDHG